MIDVNHNDYGNDLLVGQSSYQNLWSFAASQWPTPGQIVRAQWDSFYNQLGLCKVTALLNNSISVG